MWLTRKALLSIGLFIVSYGISLFLWIKFKVFYGEIVANIGAHLAAIVSGCLVESVRISQEKVVCQFIYHALTVRGPAALHFQAIIFVSKYTYNVPLTISIIFSLYPWIRLRLKNVAEAIVLLFILHVVYVFIFCCLEIYHAFLKAGVKSLWWPEQLLWEYSWAFIKAMVIRFEPFLIGAFLWIRSYASLIGGELDAVSQK